MGRISIDKKRIKSPKKREELANKLFPEFMERGIKEISANDLCEITGKSKATIYKHYDSKKEIVEYILGNKLKELSSFGEILLQNSSFENRYKNAVTFVSSILKNITPIFLQDLKELYPDLWEQVEFFKRMALEILREFYSEGIKQKKFIDINPDYLLLQDELFFNTLSNPEILTSKKLKLKDTFDAYFEIRFHGIIRN